MNGTKVLTLSMEVLFNSPLTSHLKLTLCTTKGSVDLERKIPSLISIDFATQTIADTLHFEPDTQIFVSFIVLSSLKVI